MGRGRQRGARVRTGRGAKMKEIEAIYEECRKGMRKRPIDIGRFWGKKKHKIECKWRERERKKFKRKSRKKRRE